MVPGILVSLCELNASIRVFIWQKVSGHREKPGVRMQCM